jgi:sugar phosphate isomerase/epimerase
MKRRKFVLDSAISICSLALLKCKAEQYSTLGDFGLQLWSVRHDMVKDPVGTLKRVAEIGFTDVECTGYFEGKYYNMEGNAFSQVLNDLGLTMKSCHVGTGNFKPEQKRTMTNDWEAFCEDSRNMGIQSVVCNYFDISERQTLDDYKVHAELFNTCAEKATEYGLLFGHHNHDFEFHEMEGKRPYDILLNNTDKNHVKFELDHYWINKAGVNPFDYIEKYPNRFPIWHIKDMDDTADQFFTEVGSGVIDWKKTFQYGKKAGLQYFYVEQDEFRTLEPLASVKQSHDYLRELKY